MSEGRLVREYYQTSVSAEAPVRVVVSTPEGIIKAEWYEEKLIVILPLRITEEKT